MRGSLRMLRIVVEVGGTSETAQGLKEKLALVFERYGDVKIVEIQEIEPEQMRLDLTE